MHASILKLLIILFIWTGCLLPYLSSSRQKLIKKDILKLFAWITFLLFEGLAIYGLSSFYDAITASLIWLMFVMCAWIGLTLLASHLSQRLLLVSILGISFFYFIFIFGKFYVA